MIVTPQWMKENYNKFNSEYWGGDLPNNLLFETNRSSKTWGTAHYNYVRDYFGMIKTITPTKIVMTTYYDMPEEVAQNTLVHEMIHIADYTFHPEHFINRRKYDAHGPAFFLKEAQRLKQFGWNIAKYVSQEEQSVSSLSQAQKQKQQDKIDRGIDYFIITYKTPIRVRGTYYKYGYTRINTNDKFREYALQWQKKMNNDEILNVIQFVSYTENGLRLNANRNGQWYLTNDIEAVVKKYDLDFVDYLLGSKDDDMPNMESPQTTGKIPLFKMNINNGKTIELKNTTEEEIRNTLRQKFPNWPDAAIDIIVNNNNFYPKGKNNINENMIFNLTEEQIAHFITEALEEQMNAINNDEQDINPDDPNELHKNYTGGWVE